MSRQKPEAKIVAAIKKYLQPLTDNNVLYFEHRSAGSPGYRSGLPDFWLSIDGQHIEVEVKAVGGELRPEQIRWQERFDSMGIPCYTVRSVDEVKLIVDTYKKITV